MIKINYNGFNINNLELLGSGTQGTVYKLNNDKCIKIFKNTHSFNDELHSMLISQVDFHFPRLYSYGDKYIIREYVDGITIDEYIKNYSLTDEISHKIIELYKAMYYVGFKRLDFALFHAFLSSDNSNTNRHKIMLIDTAKAMKKSYSYPSIIMKSLDKLDCKNTFINFVQKNYPETYNKWQS